MYLPHHELEAQIWLLMLVRMVYGVQSSKRLEKERTRLMCLAKMQFDDNDIMHLRLLQSVYLSFVGGPGPVGRSVAHCP